METIVKRKHLLFRYSILPIIGEITRSTNTAECIKYIFLFLLLFLFRKRPNFSWLKYAFFIHSFGLCHQHHHPVNGVVNLCWIFIFVSGTISYTFFSHLSANVLLYCSPCINDAQEKNSLQFRLSLFFTRPNQR